MKAIVSRSYGFDALRLEEVPKPEPGDDEVLVKVYASALNFATMFCVRGRPFLVRLMIGGLFKPRHKIPGGELAGRVEAVGRNIARLKPGDEVYGDTCKSGYGAFAEYACAPEACLSPMPANLSYEEAAAVPQSALVALQGLRAGGIEAGKRVLVYGASGGIGSFALQIAKALGARATGVCSRGNIELAKSLGAEEVLDYAQAGFALPEGRFDLILAVRGLRPVEEYERALAPRGAYVMAGGDWAQVIDSQARGPRVLAAAGKRFGRFTYAPEAADLAFMKGLIEAGKVRPVIDSVYELGDIIEAFRHFGEGHARGRVVIRIPSGRPDADRRESAGEIG
jgi:NADPH:quinone reductase-like Zn-dependent oxidoreductase